MDEELQDIDQAMHSVEKRADHLQICHKILTPDIALRADFSVTPFKIVGLIFLMPVFGAMALKRKIHDKKKIKSYQNDPRDYLEKRSRKYLQQLPKECQLHIAQRLMENTKNVLSKYGDQIPKLIEADRKLVTQLTNETRNQDEVLKLYVPILKKSVEMRNKITLLGIELFPATVNVSDLEWKEERVSCLGWGEFSTVYQGKLKNAGRAKSQISEVNVAVKVFKSFFDDRNKIFFLNEEMLIRYVFFEKLYHH